VTTMLLFLLWRTPIGSAKRLLHLVSSSVIMPYSFGRVVVMSNWLPVVIIRSLSSLGYVFLRAGGAVAAGCCGGIPVAAAWVNVLVWPFPFPMTSTQSSVWMRGVLEGAGVLCLGAGCGLGGCSNCWAYSIVVW